VPDHEREPVGVADPELPARRVKGMLDLPDLDAGVPEPGARR
jgi:ferric-dicitrate binding protein FerR (iron transport regulator)